ncbi:MAG: DEAD/DEAH box helicase [Clostridia bacterium]|nr:DEAD/DEAH box helicase [Clostridia bacterium]
MINDFSQLGLSNETLKAIEAMGFKTPTKIQADCIPLILEGHDVIGHSQTGTGKTMAFGLPAVDLVNENSTAVQALILCPTRELAVQAAAEIQKSAAEKQRVKVAAIYGGAPIDRQIQQLKRGAQIVIGTPGRVMDHMRRRTLKLGELKLMVLDEADEMLNMGFREDIETILLDVPEKRTTVLFSAKMSSEIMHITKNYQSNAKLIKATGTNLTVAGIEQKFISTKNIKRVDAITRLFEYHKPKLSLIFCNTKRMVDELVEELNQTGITAAALHGDMRQNGRDRVMNAFRNGSVNMLVATDVAARGIDVDDIELVINFDIPIDDEYYVHRIGRTGRAGRKGLAVTFVNGKKQQKRMSEIEKYIKCEIQMAPIPKEEDIIKMKSQEFVEKIKKELNGADFNKYYPIIDALEEDGYNARDIACALIKAKIENQKTVSSKKDNIISIDSRRTGAESGMIRFFVNAGKMDRIVPGDILGSIVGETGISGKNVGKVDIYDKFSFVEIAHFEAENVMAKFKNVMIRGRQISIEPAKERKG